MNNKKVFNFKNFNIFSNEFQDIIKSIKIFIRNFSSIQFNLYNNTVLYNNNSYTISQLISYIQSIRSKIIILQNLITEDFNKLNKPTISSIITSSGKYLHLHNNYYTSNNLDFKYHNIYQLYLTLINPPIKILSNKHKKLYSNILQYQYTSYHSLLNNQYNNFLRKTQCYYTVQYLIRYSKKQPKQKTNEWITKRMNYVTASNTAIALGKNNYQTYHNSLLQNSGITQQFRGNEATLFGEKYEDLAVKIYMMEINQNKNIIAKFFESAFIPSKDPRFFFLGGSPDGLILKKVFDDNNNLIYRDGYIIEIKCPFRRYPKKNYIPLHYWIQMQIQLEVTNLEIAYFLDFKFKEFDEYNIICCYPYSYIYKGAVIELVYYENYNIDDTGLQHYEHIISRKMFYSDIFVRNDHDNLLSDWVNKKISIIKKNEKYIRYNIKYWIVTNKCYTKVHRNRQWLYDNINQIRQYWLDINYYKHHYQELLDDLIPIPNIDYTF
jgi:putative phage-type endonuclease